MLFFKIKNKFVIFFTIIILSTLSHIKPTMQACKECRSKELAGVLPYDFCRHRDMLVYFLKKGTIKEIGPVNNFLFSGPLGTGKKTAAKELAKSIGAKIIFVDIKELTTNNIFNIVSILENIYKQADAHYEKTGQPVVIILDKIEEIAGEEQRSSDECRGAATSVMNFALQDRFHNQPCVISILITSYDRIFPSISKRCLSIFFTLPTPSDRAEILKHYLKGYPHELNQNVLSLLVQFTAGFAGGDIEFGVNEAIRLAKEQKSKNLEFAHLIEGLLHAIEKNERLSKTKVKDRALRKELIKFYAAKEEQSTEEFAQNLFARLTFNFSKNDVECMISYASALAQSEGTSINVSHLIRGFLHALQLNSRLGAIYSTQAAAVTIGSVVAAYLAYKGVILAPAVIKNIMDKLGKAKPEKPTL